MNISCHFISFVYLSGYISIFLKVKLIFPPYFDIKITLPKTLINADVTDNLRKTEEFDNHMNKFIWLLEYHLEKDTTWQCSHYNPSTQEASVDLQFEASLGLHSQF